MKTINITTILFDVDGVLLDSVPTHFSAWEKAFKEKNITLSYDDYLHKLNGLPRLVGVQRMAPDLSLQEQEAIAARKQQYLLDIVSDTALQPLPGVVPFLQELQKRHIKMSAASSSKNAATFLTAADIQHYFLSVITGNDFTHPKPDPDIFLTAAHSVQSSPESCLVIEDATAGVKAAKAAGMTTIGLTSSEDKTISQIADLTLSSIEEYPSILALLPTH